MINPTGDAEDTLSDREKNVVISLVQDMSNKEIADHLSISTNTVITTTATSPANYRFIPEEVSPSIPSRINWWIYPQ